MMGFAGINGLVKVVFVHQNKNQNENGIMIIVHA